ncbi:MAG: carboxymuconolactone decarboxylase family protein [Halioglobus sp.]|nr:carboxymuconolactone decarboxylase family protein [Halioglobus sp.]
MNATETKPTTPLCDQLRASGNWNTTDNWDTIAELDPEWMEKFMQMGMHAMMKKSGLDALTWEFIAIAVDASCTHMYAPGTRRHIRKALELGATTDQVMAVLEGVAVLGLHSVAMGAPILKEEAARVAAANSK